MSQQEKSKSQPEAQNKPTKPKQSGPASAGSRKPRLDPKSTRDTAVSASAKKVTARPAKTTGVIPLSISALQSRIKNLEKEITRLQKAQESHVCPELSEVALQQIADAQTLQAAAEAELEGLQHIKDANKKLMEQHGADAKQIVDLICQVQIYEAKLRELEKTNDDGVQHLGTTTLDFSAIVTAVCIAPIDVHVEDTELDELRERLSTVEMEKDQLLSDFTRLSTNHRETIAEVDAQIERIHALHQANLVLAMRNDDLTSQLETYMQRLRARDHDTRHQVAQVRADVASVFQAQIGALRNQRPRAYSTFSDPDFVASLRDPATASERRSLPAARAWRH